jgi:hypothetical protein
MEEGEGGDLKLAGPGQLPCILASPLPKSLPWLCRSLRGKNTRPPQDLTDNHGILAV